MPVKKYKALLRQLTPITIDTIAVFVDQVGGQWKRVSPGVYFYVKPGAFPFFNVYIPAYLNGNSGGVYTDINGIYRSLEVIDNDTLQLSVTENGISSDGFIENFPIEFEVYS